MRDNEKRRQRGRITNFVKSRGFGFIQRSDSADQIFFHISNVVGNVEPAAGDAVTFELGSRYDGRPKATNIDIALES
jgi:cold shock CspA family protein